MSNEDQPIKCPRDGRFVRTRAYSGQSSEELIWCKCTCGNAWSEGY